MVVVGVNQQVVIDYSVRSLLALDWDHRYSWAHVASGLGRDSSSEILRWLKCVIVLSLLMWSLLSFAMKVWISQADAA